MQTREGGGQKIKHIGEIIYTMPPRGKLPRQMSKSAARREGGRNKRREKLVNAEESKKVAVAAEAQRNAARFEEFALSIANLIHQHCMGTAQHI